MINKIIRNSVQQILVLIDHSKFILNCTFQVLCCVGASSVYSFFQLSAQKEVWYRDAWRTCWPRDVSKMWNNLMEEIADHVHTAVWLSWKICPKLLLLMPRMCECCRVTWTVLKWFPCFANIFFSMHSSWSTMRTVSYTASVFKLMYPQQNRVAWRNHTMPTNNKLLSEATLCTNDGLRQ